MKVNRSLSFLFKIQIILSAGIKVLRGIIKSAFFKKSKGLLFIGKHVQILNIHNIEVGRNVKFEDFAEIQGLASEAVCFDDNVTIGRNVQIRPSSYYGVGHIGAGLTIGKHSSIGPNGFIGCAGKISIGSNVMIGPNVTIIAENHNFNNKESSIKSQGVKQQGVSIEDDVWIGANVIILDGVSIKSGTVIGAGCIVTKNISSNQLVIDKRDKIIKAR